MPVYKRTFYDFTCDKCGWVYEMPCGDKKTAKTVMEYHGWYIGKKKVICCDCIKEGKK